MVHKMIHTTFMRHSTFVGPPNTNVNVNVNVDMSVHVNGNVNVNVNVHVDVNVNVKVNVSVLVSKFQSFKVSNCQQTQLPTFQVVWDTHFQISKLTTLKFPKIIFAEHDLFFLGLC